MGSSNLYSSEVADMLWSLDSPVTITDCATVQEEILSGAFVSTD